MASDATKRSAHRRGCRRCSTGKQLRDERRLALDQIHPSAVSGDEGPLPAPCFTGPHGLLAGHRGGGDRAAAVELTRVALQRLCEGALRDGRHQSVVGSGSGGGLPRF